MKVSLRKIWIIPAVFGLVSLKSCFQEPAEYKSNRSVAASNTGDASADDSDGPDGSPAETVEDEEAPDEEQGLTGYVFTWEPSADTNVDSYKVFVVPPEMVPLEVKSIPVANVVEDGTNISTSVTPDEVKAALGTATVIPADYCFSIVAVNGVGNSEHSAKVCMTP